jgi:3-phosphoshikimate 1-carboxyvinyltransferase
MDQLEIQPFAGSLNTTVQPPGSKSLTNRALACAALADGRSVLTGALDSEDTRVMIDALQKLGIGVAVDDSRTTLTVDGCGGKIPAKKAELYVANSGTTVRFLTALVALGHGEYLLVGTPRMRERPIQDLLDSLQILVVRSVCFYCMGWCSFVF